MKLIITGTPGTGKSTLGKALAKKFKCRLVSEIAFVKRHGLGKLDKASGELVVDTKKLEHALNLLLEKQKNVVVEGHLLCETRLKADLVIVLRQDPAALEKILAKRGYNDVKVLDNVFAERNGYCLMQAKKHYLHKKIVEVFVAKSIKETTSKILSEL